MRQPIFATSKCRAALALGLALCLPAIALAEKSDRDKPIFYQGDTGGANLSTKDGELAGSVVITQGTLTIHADRITFHQNPDNSLSAVAYGNPVTFREKRDGVDEYYEGQAQRAVYDGSKRFLELFDRAQLRKSGDEIRSNYITYDAANDVFKAEGRPDAKAAEAGDSPLGSRVRGVFQPQAKGDNAKSGEGASKDDKGKSSSAATGKDDKSKAGDAARNDAKSNAKSGASDAASNSAKSATGDASAAAPANPPLPLKGDTSIAPSAR
jgi:lipopolysaccharide export system protein LptA